VADAALEHCLPLGRLSGNTKKSQVVEKSESVNLGPGALLAGGKKRLFSVLLRQASRNTRSASVQYCS
jgi:hypothetical protein